MKTPVTITNDGVEKSIKAIGQSLIDRASDIAKDVDDVTSITIFALLDPSAIVNFDITKNYIARIDKEENEQR